MSKERDKTSNLKYEEIITRHKANQMKRHLRNKDYSMKSITDLLRSPNSYRRRRDSRKGIPKKLDSSIALAMSHTTVRQYPGKKPARKIELKEKEKEFKKSVATNGEYYPDKMRRNSKIKPIRLRAQNELVTIGELNKRKRTIPRRGVSRTPSPKPESNIETEYYKTTFVYGPINEKKYDPDLSSEKETKEESIEELIRMTEIDGMTDEDLMEILTCPSPVWWEMAPGYDEEPINKHEENSKKEDVEEAINIKNGNITQNEPLAISQTKFDEKFYKKRSVLENLLSNIKKSANVSTESENKNANKNKLNEDENKKQNAPKKADKKVINMTYKELLKKREIEIQDGETLKDKNLEKDSVNSKVDVMKSDIIKPSENNEKVIADSNDKSSNKTNDSILVDENAEKNETEKIFSTKRKSRKRCHSSDSVQIINVSKATKFTDNDKGSNETENIILEKNKSKDTCFSTTDENKTTANSLKRRHSFENDSKALEELENIEIPTGKKSKLAGDVIVIDSPRTSESGCYDEIEDVSTVEENVINKIPKILPPLEQFRLVNSPASLKYTSESDDVNSINASTQDALDTISDTNIRFLTDDHESEDDSINNTKDSQSESKDSDTKDIGQDIEGAIKDALRVFKNKSTEERKKDENYLVIYKIDDKSNKNDRLNKLDFTTKLDGKKEVIIKNAGIKYCPVCRERNDFHTKVLNFEKIIFCSKCSTKVDTGTCIYCKQKSTESEGIFECQICFCKCCCENNLKVHVTNHISLM